VSIITGKRLACGEETGMPVTWAVLVAAVQFVVFLGGHMVAYGKQTARFEVLEQRGSPALVQHVQEAAQRDAAVAVAIGRLEEALKHAQTSMERRLDRIEGKLDAR
jgi:hypothetical protein